MFFLQKNHHFVLTKELQGDSYCKRIMVVDVDVMVHCYYSSRFNIIVFRLIPCEINTFIIKVSTRDDVIVV